MSACYTLMERLMNIQRQDGYVTRAAAAAVVKDLALSLSQVYSVLTFYSRFRFAPRGERMVKVCTGTTCRLRGGDEILHGLSEKLGVEAGGTTQDGRFSLDVVACIGACGLAPVVVLDGDVRGRCVPGKIEHLMGQAVEKPSELFPITHGGST